MTPEKKQSGIPRSHFSHTTLQTIVNVARKDVQKIESAIAAATKTGAPTAHWNERLRQSTDVLKVAMKEYQVSN